MSEIILLDDAHTCVRRFSDAGKHSMSLLNSIFVEKGDLSDWKQLKELHYRSSSLGIGPRYMRCALEDGTERGQTIGCMVFTVPKPLDAGRNIVFPHMRPNQAGGRDTTMMNKQRMHWLNRNLILSSRTVLDTMYRGAGVAYRFKSIGYRLMGFRYIESRSSMSRYNPFSLKAGMRFVAPKSAPALEQGLKFFSKWFASPAYDYVAIKEELAGMPDALRIRTLRALREFYYLHSSMEKSGENRLNGTSRIDSMEIGYLLKQIQQLVFGATVYAVWVNPDWGRELPKRIPLQAFENQAVDEPLRLDLLDPRWLK